MKLAVDANILCQYLVPISCANILVAELLRRRGRMLVKQEALELYIAEKPWQEARHELARRALHMVHQDRFSQTQGVVLLGKALALAEERIVLISYETYAPQKTTARRRIPRDPDDWPTVSLALVLDADIWTQDGDFLGCGVATWTTETLLSELTA